jgi:hypothetical protein
MEKVLQFPREGFRQQAELIAGIQGFAEYEPILMIFLKLFNHQNNPDDIDFHKLQPLSTLAPKYLEWKKSPLTNRLLVSSI